MVIHHCLPRDLPQGQQVLLKVIVKIQLHDLVGWYSGSKGLVINDIDIIFIYWLILGWSPIPIFHLLQHPCAWGHMVRSWGIMPTSSSGFYFWNKYVIRINPSPTFNSSNDWKNTHSLGCNLVRNLSHSCAAGPCQDSSPMKAVS